MNDWALAIAFGCMLIGFVLGLSNIIMGLLVSASESSALQQRIEYIFFGISGLVATGVFGYVLL